MNTFVPHLPVINPIGQGYRGHSHATGRGGSRSMRLYPITAGHKQHFKKYSDMFFHYPQQMLFCHLHPLQMLGCQTLYCQWGLKRRKEALTIGLEKWKVWPHGKFFVVKDVHVMTTNWVKHDVAARLFIKRCISCNSFDWFEIIH